MRWARRSLATVMVGAMVVAGCAPPPGGAPTLVWTSTLSGGGPMVGGITPQAAVVGSNSSWYVQFDTDSSGVSSTLSFYPRTGLDGNALGTPQVLTGSPIGIGGGFLGDQIFLGGSTPTSGGALQFYLESGGTWATAGTFPVPTDGVIRGITDDTLLVVRGDGSYAGQVEVYDLTVVSGVVTPVLENTFTAPPAWGANYAANFGAGTGASLDGDLFAVASRDIVTNGPGRVAVYRNTGGTWALEDTFVGSVNQFGRSLGIDDQGASARLAIGIVDYPNAGSVELYTSSGGSWTFEQTLTPPGGVVDTFGGTEFGDRVSLDGNLVVAGVRSEPLAPTVGGDPRGAVYHSVFHLSAGSWAYEGALQAVDTPLDPDDGNRGPLSVIVHDNHVAATSLVSLPPNGCMFCFNIRLEAWRWDRTPLP